MKLLTVKDVLKLLNVSRTTLWKLTNIEGKIPAYSIGGSIRYKEEEVLEYIKNYKKKKVGKA
jgi:excisionase family DNA binding protein